MILIKVVLAKELEDAGLEAPVYPYSGSDEKMAIEKAHSFFNSHPVAFMGSRKIEVLRVTDTELITTIEFEKPDTKKLMEGVLDLLRK